MIGKEFDDNDIINDKEAFIKKHDLRNKCMEDAYKAIKILEDNGYIEKVKKSNKFFNTINGLYSCEEDKIVRIKSQDVNPRKITKSVIENIYGEYGSLSPIEYDKISGIVEDVLSCLEKE